MQKKVLFVGGDKRQLYAGKRMQKEGFSVCFIGINIEEGLRELQIPSENAEKETVNTDILILPVPATKDGIYVLTADKSKIKLSDIAENTKPDTKVFGGMLSETLCNLFFQKGIKVFDYYQSEEVAMLNAVPTAQGVLKIMLNHSEKILAKSNVVVTGYGKTAKVICHYLKGMDMFVTLCARKGADRALAQGMGMKCLPLEALTFAVKDADYIINTVPAPLLNREVLASVPQEALIIDIASKPFGTDFLWAQRYGIQAIQAGSLPGKTTPQTAGEIIADAIMKEIGGSHYD